MEKYENKENAHDKELEEFDLDPPEERKRKIKNRFFDACKKNDISFLLKIIDDEMLNIFDLDDNKWTGLHWAVVNNHPEIVKILLEKEANIKYNTQEELLERKVIENIKESNKTEFDDIFKKPVDPSVNAVTTPLHWAAYKGYNHIASLLLKYGANPLDIDSYGNNSLHQASASNRYDTFKMFMGLGVDLELKNLRSHMAFDLTSNKDIQNLILRALKVKACQLCAKNFDFFTKRYICSIKEEVICKHCVIADYYYLDTNAKKKEMFDCRCINCYNEISEVENNLRKSIESNIIEDLLPMFNNAKKFKICTKLTNEAQKNVDRLTKEKQILEHLNNLKIVDNHKTIEKSVFMLEEMIKLAAENNIELDDSIKDKAYLEKNRLIAEKELRKILSNLNVGMSSKENLDLLNEKIENAKKCMVELKYINESLELSKKMELNLRTKEILDLFTAYPIREYPVIEPIDPKNRKKKPQAPVKGKRKKKEPPFLIPEWAKELKDLVDKVTLFKQYLDIANDIGLDETFLTRSKEQLIRFGKEIAFRRNEEEVLRKLEEEKKKKKGKKR